MLKMFQRISLTLCLQCTLSYLLLWMCVLLHQWTCIAAYAEIPRKLLSPRFLPTPTNLTYERGEVATLFCSVTNLGTKTITWRKQPYHVPLFIGTQSFVSIDRFYLSHLPNRGEWNLLIKNVQTFDSGVYECQVSSSQELRRNITLNVIDKLSASSPYIEITGTRFVEKGGDIRLHCNASGSKMPHGHIDWFKDGNLLRNRTKIGNVVSITNKSILSTLVISNAVVSDAGTYVCRTSDLLTTRFRVDVLKAGTKQYKREYGEFSTGTRHRNLGSRHTGLITVILACLQCYYCLHVFAVTRR